MAAYLSFWLVKKKYSTLRRGSVFTSNPRVSQIWSKFSPYTVSWPLRSSTTFLLRLQTGSDRSLSQPMWLKLRSPSLESSMLSTLAVLRRKYSTSTYRSLNLVSSGYPERQLSRGLAVQVVPDLAIAIGCTQRRSTQKWTSSVSLK